MTWHALYKEKVEQFDIRAAARGMYSDQCKSGDIVVAFWTVNRRWRVGKMYDGVPELVEQDGRLTTEALTHIKYVGLKAEQRIIIMDFIRSV